MEQRIKRLIKRLTFLGYCTFEIKNIIKQVTGTDDLSTLDYTKEFALIGQLEMYERLGLNFLQDYSK